MKQHYIFYALTTFILISVSCKSFSIQNPSNDNGDFIPTTTTPEINNDSNPSEWLTFVGTDKPAGAHIKSDNQGNIYILHGNRINHSSQSLNELSLVKFSSNGVKEWTTIIIDKQHGDEISLVIDSQDNIYVLGSSHDTWGNPINSFAGTGQYANDIFITKINGEGSVLWNTFLNSGNTSDNIAIDAENNIYILTLDDYSRNPVLVKIDSNGNIQTKTPLDSPLASIRGVKVDANNNVYATGMISTGSWDCFIAKFTNEGKLLWQIALGSEGNSQCQTLSSQIEIDLQGNVYLLGESNGEWGTPLNPYDGGFTGYTTDYLNGVEFFIATLDKDSNLLWHTFINKSTWVDNILLDNNGSLYFSGYSDATWGNPSQEYSGGEKDGVVGVIDTNGSMLSNFFVGSEGSDKIFSMDIDKNYLYIAGRSDLNFGIPITPKTGETDSFIFKIKLK